MRMLKPHYIKEWRKHCGLTQERLAAKAGCSKSLISYLESFKSSYTQERLEKLASALKCNAVDLLLPPNGFEKPAVELHTLIKQLTKPEQEHALQVLRAVFTKKTNQAA